MNDSGQIIGEYLTSGSVGKPFTWDPSTGVNAIGESALGGAVSAGISIGNNGNLAINSTTMTGNLHAANGAMNGTTVTDEGTLPGGNNSKYSMLSRDGCYGTGTSDRTGGNKTAFLVAFTTAGCQ